MLNIKIVKEDNCYIFKGFNEEVYNIGTLRLCLDNPSSRVDKSYIVSDFFIKEEYRGKGYAKEFLKALASFIKNDLKEYVIVEAIPYRKNRKERRLSAETLYKLYKKYLNDDYFIVISSL